MTDERIAKLDEIGFEWRRKRGPKEKKYEECFAAEGCAERSSKSKVKVK